MGKTTRKQYTDEFKTEAVKLALTADQPRSQIASDLGIATSTLSRWISERRASNPNTSQDDDMNKELARLRRENKILRQERDMLKKATAFFAKHAQ